MNYLVLLLRPDRSDVIQAFGPYPTMEDAEHALEQLAQWPGLRGQWELCRLTQYMAGDIAGAPLAPSTPLRTPAWPQPYTQPLGPVYCGQPDWCATPTQVTYLSSPANTTCTTPTNMSDIAPKQCDGETAAQEQRRPQDAGPRVYRVHPPADRSWPGAPIEVLAAYHTSEDGFVHFKDNNNATVLTIRCSEIGMIERLRTHTVLAISEEELHLLSSALDHYTQLFLKHDESRSKLANECAKHLQALQADARQRAEHDMSMRREQHTAD